MDAEIGATAGDGGAATGLSSRWLVLGLFGAVIVIIAFTLLEAAGHGTAAIALLAACGVGASVLAWRLMPEAAFDESRRDGASQDTNNSRFNLRVLAWRKMQVGVALAGQRPTETNVLNLSFTGMALDWKEPPLPTGSEVELRIVGYRAVPAYVVTCGRGALRLRFAKHVTPAERKRLRSDCMKGSWGAARSGGTKPWRR